MLNKVITNQALYQEQKQRQNQVTSLTPAQVKVGILEKRIERLKAGMAVVKTHTSPRLC